MKIAQKMTHAELVKIAAKWLQNYVRCGFVLTELKSIAGEIPDAVGWKYNQSILVECKTSRADFLADKKKIFRRRPDMGIGVYRFYLSPPDVIKKRDLPDKWGLLYAENGKIKKIVAPSDNIWSEYPHFQSNLKSENELMCSALRRVQQNGDLRKLNK